MRPHSSCPRDLEIYRQAAKIIRNARALVIAAGAGMGVDSGLPDFRGPEGFWRAYPAYRKLGIRFEEAANPVHFHRDPTQAWGFYGHRLALYRSAAPHLGFSILLQWARERFVDHFVVTSNVDGQFQKAGFDEEKVYEVHGSIHHLQCLDSCTGEIWRCQEEVAVDAETMRAEQLPLCPRCGGVARPNILMFGDWSWHDDRSRRQGIRVAEFLERHRSDLLAVVEIGAGTGVPTIRHFCENLGAKPGVRVIRINLREASIPLPHLAVTGAALDSLSGINEALLKMDPRED